MTYADLGAPELITSVSDDARTISSLLRRHGGSAPVGHCPGWLVRDVVAHLGDVHRWATEIVRTGQPAADGHPAPDGDPALADWFDQGAEELTAVLIQTDPETPCWTFGLPPAVAGLWRRRQALETAVHRFDVERAIGLDSRLPVDLAVAGVTEVVEFMYPRQVTLLRTPAPDFMITFAATDTDDRWTMGTAGPAAGVSGPVVDLLLMLWGRPHDAVARDGDARALRGLADAVVTP